MVRPAPDGKGFVMRRRIVLGLAVAAVTCGLTFGMGTAAQAAPHGSGSGHLQAARAADTLGDLLPALEALLGTVLSAL
jgi:hypothetical protein